MNKKYMFLLTSIVILVIITILTNTKKQDQTTFINEQEVTEIEDTDITVSSTPNESKTFTEFYEDFKTAVANHDVATVASMVQYPLSIAQNKEEFIKKYDTLFTESLKTVVADQASEEFFENAEGIMIGDGQIWFFDYSIFNTDGSTTSTPDYRIKSINL